MRKGGRSADKDVDTQRPFVVTGNTTTTRGDVRPERDEQVCPACRSGYHDQCEGAMYAPKNRRCRCGRRKHTKG